MAASTLFVGASSLGFFLLSIAVYRLFFHPLARVPGPKLAAISILWLAYHSRKGKNHTFQPNLHKKYGPIVRISPNQVLVCSEEAVRAAYSAGSPYVKGPWYQVCKAPGSKARGDDAFDLLTERDKERYRLQRRAIGPTYSIAAMEKHEHLLDRFIHKYIGRLKTYNGSWIDLAEWMHIYTLDGIATFTLSKSPGYSEKGNDADNMAVSDKHWGYFTVVGLFPWIVNITQNLPKTGMYLRIPISLFFALPIPTGLPIFGFAIPNVLERMSKLESLSQVEPPKDRPGLQTSLRADDLGEKDKDAPPDGEEEDLLASVIKSHMSKEERFRPAWVLGILITTFGAGHDTMTTTLSSAIYLICTNPAVKSRLLRDLQEAGITTESSYNDIILKVPYLMACLKEAMRMHPAIGMNLQRVVPPSGATLCDTYLPPGTHVGVHPWAIHLQLADVFPEPEKFNPERWLADGTEEKKKAIGRMDACWLGFGGGSRSCPGQYFAKFFVIKLLACLFTEFGDGLDVNGEADFVGWFSCHFHGADVRFAAKA